MQTQKSAQSISAQDFKTKVLGNEKFVLVDFWATWCMPCLMMAPVLDEMANTFADQLEVIKINTEEPDNQALAVEYNIQSIPNMKLFKAGKMVKEFIGFRTKEQFEQELKAVLGGK